MTFIARKPFLYNGVKFDVGDEVTGYPGKFDHRAETFVRAGYIKEIKLPEPKDLIEIEARALEAGHLVGTQEQVEKDIAEAKAFAAAQVFEDDAMEAVQPFVKAPSPRARKTASKPKSQVEV